MRNPIGILIVGLVLLIIGYFNLSDNVGNAVQNSTEKRSNFVIKRINSIGNALKSVIASSTHP